MLLNRGPGGTASLVHVPQSSMFSPTATAHSGAWGPNLSLCWFSLLHLMSNSSDLQLTDFLFSPGLYNNLTYTLLPASVTILHSFNSSTVKVIISWYSSTGCTCYLHRCISYFDSPAGSEVQHSYNTCSILVYLPLSVFFSRLCSIHVMHPYNSIDTTAAKEETAFHFIRQVWLPYDR